MCRSLQGQIGSVWEGDRVRTACPAQSIYVMHPGPQDPTLQLFLSDLMETSIIFSNCKVFWFQIIGRKTSKAFCLQSYLLFNVQLQISWPEALSAGKCFNTCAYSRPSWTTQLASNIWLRPNNASFEPVRFSSISVFMLSSCCYLQRQDSKQYLQ